MSQLVELKSNVLGSSFFFQDSVSLHTRSSCETHSLYVMVYNDNNISWGNKCSMFHHSWNGLEPSSLYTIHFEFELNQLNSTVRYFKLCTILIEQCFCLTMVQMALYIQLDINGEEVATIKVCMCTCCQVQCVMRHVLGLLQLQPQTSREVSVWAAPNSNGSINLHIETVSVQKLCVNGWFQLSIALSWFHQI